MRIIFEGLWAVGKTTCCEYLRDKHGFYFLEEPDYKKVKNIEGVNLDDWYKQKHLQNINLSLSLKNKHVVIERSVSSTLAYSQSCDNSYKVSGSDIQLLRNNHQEIDFCVILHINYNDYLNYKDNLQNHHLKEFINQNREFIRNYEDNLINFCKLLFGENKVYVIDVFDKNKLIPKEIIFSKINNLLFK
jgi:thymidylate kinase